MEVTGKVKYKSGDIQVTDSFKKSELVVTTDEQYPQSIMIEFVQDKCDLLNNYNVGENVKVSINLRGREWVNPEGETKYFNQIQGWKIEKLNDAPVEGSFI
jgi:translation initiation factor IF-3